MSSCAQNILHTIAISILLLAPIAGCAGGHVAVAPEATEPGGAWVARAQGHIAAREYRASENEEGLQAPNRRHALRTYFEPTGIRVVDRVAGGSPELLALRLRRLGRPKSLTPVGPGEVSHDGPRVEIRREAVVEWYVNDPTGLEQGFTLAAPPAGSGPLLLELSLEGARASQSGQSLRITTATGRKLDYGQLSAFDATGTPLRVTQSAPEEDQIRLSVDDSKATYPIVVDPLISAAPADAQLEGGQSTAHLGFSVSGAGDVNGDGYSDIILGAWRYDAGQTDEGAAFVFLGSASGIADASAAAAHAQLESDQADARMGEYVGGAGDVNGDGYDDVIVGAFWYDDPEIDEGAAFVFLGSASGIADATPATAHAQLEADQEGAEMGISVDSAGDVNQDGYGDVIVGAHFYNGGLNEEGAAFVFLGSAGGIVGTTPATAHAQNPGTSYWF